MSKKLSILFLVLFALSACSRTGSRDKNVVQMVDKKAPELIVEKWVTQQPDVKGKFILVDFWATWCPPCIVNIPALNHIHERFKDKLVVIGLSNEKEEKVKAFKLVKIAYPLAIDTQQRMRATLNSDYYPYALLIDPAGIVRWQGNPKKNVDNLSEEKIERILKAYGS